MKTRAQARQRRAGDAARRATLQDVARACGVHPSTVSRALDPATQHLISDDLVARIVAAGRALNYQSRHNRPSSRIIGVLIPDLTNPIFPPIIRGIEDRLAGLGYLVTVLNTDGSLARERNAVETLIDQKVAGLIVASSSLDDSAFEAAVSRGTPVVTVNRRAQCGTLPFVVNDDAEGIRRVIVHLLSLGHRSLAAIAGPQTLSTGRVRYEVLQALREEFAFELAPRNTVISQSYSIAEGQRCMELLLAGKRDFTAVVCANDQLAVGANSAIRRSGLNCPQDISLTGFNDMPLADQIHPPLTTVRIEQHRGGERAAEVLLRYLEAGAGEAPEAPVQVVLPVDLVVRGSTAAPLASRAAPRPAN